MKFAFSKLLRLLSRKQFRMRGSAKKYGRFLVVELKPNELGFNRLGITASRRYGNAVKRNRFKRIVREAFRLTHTELGQGFDLNVAPRPFAEQAQTQQIAEEIRTLTRISAGS